MAAHYIATYRGKQSGATPTDWTFDTSSTAAADIELRIEDAIAWTRLEVVEALKGLIRVLEEPSLSTYPKI